MSIVFLSAGYGGSDPGATGFGMQEVSEANASGAVLAVSFHANAGKGNGSET